MTPHSCFLVSLHLPLPLTAAAVLLAGLAAAPVARSADAAAPAPASTAPASAQRAAASAFNPAIWLILSGGYTQLQRDPASWRLAGFQTGGEIGPGSRGFGLGESELGLSASIDPRFFGSMTVALSDDEGAAVEEAYVQTTALPAGLTLKFGRFLSGLGYQNELHAHAWAFIDAPLAHQAFLGGQRREDGLQLRWLAPTELFTELGVELGRGESHPGAAREKNGAGAWTVFGHLGGDIGASQSWRAGLSLLSARPQGRESSALDAAGNEVTHAFSGRSRTWVVDGVWKWAPEGNAQSRWVSLQGEWFRRQESGTLVADSAGLASAAPYRATQSGAYLQGVWQFMPGWRAGLRGDWLRVGTVDAGANAALLASARHDPSRGSLLLDWVPSEFSRVRLQVAQDRVRAGVNDRQVMLQYQMSLGAHGAHSY